MTIRSENKIKTFFTPHQQSAGFSRGALILALTSVLSYLLGLIRDRLLAAKFGASAELDVYQSSFIIPDLILNIFLAAALASAVVPVLSGYFSKNENAEAFRVTSYLLNLICLVLIIICFGTYFFMPSLVTLIAPGFIETKKNLLIETSRIILLSPIIFGLSNLLGGALVSLKKFFAYSFSPILYNLGIILGIYFLADRFGVKGVAFGTVIGAFLHLAVRLLALIKSNFRYTLVTTPMPAGAKNALALMVPRIFGLAAVQGSLWAYNYVGSKLPEGSIGVFNLARNFQSLPVSFIGISLATAAFPYLSADFAAEKLQNFQSHFSSAFKKIIFLTLPTSFGLALLSRPVIAIFLGSGKFNTEAIILTSSILAFFCAIIPFESIDHLLSRTFYAKKDTLKPVIISLFSMAVNIIACFALAKIVGLYGLPLSFLVGAVIQNFLLLIFLKKDLAFLSFRGVFSHFLKVLLASIFMTATLGVILKFCPANGSLRNQLLVLFSSLTLGGLVYFLAAFLLKIGEIKDLTQLIRKKIFVK